MRTARRDDPNLREKERPGYQWGPRWGAYGSSSPALAWGQTLFVSGEEIFSVTIPEANIMPEKNRANPRHRWKIFSLFAT